MKKGIIIPIILLLVTSTLIGGGAYYFLAVKNKSEKVKNIVEEYKPELKNQDKKQIDSSPVAIANTNCIGKLTYKNLEHYFSFKYPCSWGSAKDETKKGDVGYKLSMIFDQLREGTIYVGGASNDYSVGRGYSFGDFGEKEVFSQVSPAIPWPCGTTPLICIKDQIPNNRILSMLVYPLKLDTTDLYQGKVEIPQNFDPYFHKDVYFDIYNSKISVLGMRLYFIADKEAFYKRMELTYPNYVRIARNHNLSPSVEEASLYNQDVDKLNKNIALGGNDLIIDERTKENLDNFAELIDSFRFEK